MAPDGPMRPDARFPTIPRVPPICKAVPVLYQGFLIHRGRSLLATPYPPRNPSHFRVEADAADGGCAREPMEDAVESGERKGHVRDGSSALRLPWNAHFIWKWIVLSLALRNVD